MVQRRRLTVAAVDAAEPPRRGEKWIPDTKLRGFGLRLWATKSGGRKAYAIRVTDRDGYKVRKTFNLHNSWRYKFNKRVGPDCSFGEYLNDARDWARDEIDRLKGRPTLYEEEIYLRERAANVVRRMSFGRAAQNLLSGMRSAGRSHAYTDRLDGLFENNLPSKLKQKPLYRVSAKAVARAIVHADISPGSARILKSFIGQIFERGISFDGPLGRFSKTFSNEFWASWEKQRDVSFPELRKMTPDDYAIIFARLENESNYWQQAMCIRIYFEFGAPLTRLMAAEWRQLVDGHWYPYWPDEKVFWFESQEKITAVVQELLDRLSFFAQRDFVSSRFWFPTRCENGAKHINAVDAYWRRTLHSCGSRYYPLRDFALSRRPLNNPSYVISFLRQYGRAFRQIGNAAEVSKILMGRKN